jgi:hypothetical protein
VRNHDFILAAKARTYDGSSFCLAALLRQFDCPINLAGLLALLLFFSLPVPYYFEITKSINEYRYYFYNTELHSYVTFAIIGSFAL